MFLNDFNMLMLKKKKNQNKHELIFKQVSSMWESQ